MFSQLYNTIRGNQSADALGSNLPLPPTQTNDINAVKTYQRANLNNYENALPFHSRGKEMINMNTSTRTTTNPGGVIQNLLRTEQVIENAINSCTNKSLDYLTQNQNLAAATRCGWIYKKGGNGIPRVSQGAYGTRKGPSQITSTSLPAGDWYWDLQQAKNIIHRDTCAEMTSCADLTNNKYKGKCAWCSEGRGIPINERGQTFMALDPLGSCAGTLYKSATSCPREGADQLVVDGNGLQYSIGNRNITCGPECLKEALSEAGCTDKGTIANALSSGGRPDNYFYSIDTGSALQAYRQQANKLEFLRNMQSGSISKQTALDEFTELKRHETATAASKELNYSARDLCTSKGNYELFNFCMDYTDSTSNPALECIQKEFLLQGGQRSGSYYPSNPSASGYKYITNNGTYSWGQVKERIQQLKGRASGLIESFVGDLFGTQEQNLSQSIAIKQFLGSNILNLQSSQFNKVDIMIFKQIGGVNMLWNTLTDSTELINSGMTTQYSDNPADIILYSGRITPKSNMNIKLGVNSTGDTAIAINTFMWNRAPGVDTAGLFTVAGNTTDREQVSTNCIQIKGGAETPDTIKILKKNILSSITYRDCDSGSSSKPKLMESLEIVSTRSDNTPLLYFAVYVRNYGTNIISSSTTPLFYTTTTLNNSNSGLDARFEEFTHPEFFPMSFSNTEIDRTQNNLKLSTINSQALCHTLLSNNAWKNIIFTFRINTNVYDITKEKHILYLYPISCILTYTNNGGINVAVVHNNKKYVSQTLIVKGAWYSVSVVLNETKLLLYVTDVTLGEKMVQPEIFNIDSLQNQSNIDYRLQLGRKDGYESLVGDIKYINVYKDIPISIEAANKRIKDEINNAGGFITIQEVVVPKPNNSVVPVRFYEHCDYQGMSFSLPRGRYPLSQLQGFLAASLLSSVRIPQGITVTLYTGTNFDGRSVVLQGGFPYSCLLDQNFNDSTRSIVIE